MVFLSRSGKPKARSANSAPSSIVLVPQRKFRAPVAAYATGEPGKVAAARTVGCTFCAAGRYGQSAGLWLVKRGRFCFDPSPAGSVANSGQGSFPFFMAMTIGFVLLTFNKPRQAVRLVETLNHMFDQAPIAWHHDFTQSPLPLERLTKNIHLVLPNINTSWGKFSIVEAMLRSLQLLYQSKYPDWFVTLSGSDYPIKSADTILHDLTKSPFDVHVHHEKILFSAFDRHWQKICYDRYCAVRIPVPSLNAKLGPVMRSIKLRHPAFTSWRTPFSKEFPCFAGEGCFYGRRSTAEYLIDYHRTKPKLSGHYRKREVPDESYFHTILCNGPFKASQNNWRYIDWSEGRAHPKTLVMEDLTKICGSTAHFARKFDADVDERILDALDECIFS